MNILHVVVLFAIAMECATASTYPSPQFRTAIDTDDLKAAVDLCKQNRYLCSKEIDYVIETKLPEFVVQFIRQAGEVNRFTLARVYAKGSPETVKKVLDELPFADYDLSEVASLSELMCSPDDALSLISRIKVPALQEHAVSGGISRLFPAHTDCVDPMLTVLGDSKFLNKRVKDTAVQVVFERGAYFEQDYWIERFWDHSAITPEIYAKGLYKSWSFYEQHNPVFSKLLERADRGDLLVALSDKHKNESFIAFSQVEEALPAAHPEGTRQSTRQKAETSRRIIAEATGTSQELEGFGDIFSAYATAHPTTRKRAKTTKQTVTEVTKTRTPEPTPEIGDILGDYVGEDEEG